MLRFLAITSALSGCMVGDDPEAAGSLEAKTVLANTLSWDGFSSDCAKPTGIRSIGGSLSVLFDQGASWSTCTVTGTLHVPANVKLVSLRQDVATYGDDATIKYKAAVNRVPVVVTSFGADGMVFSTPLSTIGQSLCAKPDTRTRDVQVQFVVSHTGTVHLDSVDWSVSVVRCPQ